LFLSFFFFQVEDGIRDRNVTGVQTCALPISDFDLVLYGRNVSSRLSDKVSDRVLLVDGNFEEFDKIKENLVDVDAVYLNYVAGDDLIKPLVEILEESGIERFIAASVPDLYQEITGKFKEWYRANTGIMWKAPQRKAADIVESS